MAEECQNDDCDFDGRAYSPQSFQEMCQHFAQALVGRVISKHAEYGAENVVDQGIYGVAGRIREKGARIRNLYDNEASNDPIIEEFLDIAGVALTGYALARGWWRRETVCPPLLPRH